MSFGKAFQVDNWHHGVNSLSRRNGIKTRRWGMRVTIYTGADAGEWVLTYGQSSTNLQDNGNWLKVADIGQTWGGGGGGVNIYNADGVVTGNRSVEGGDLYLMSFSGFTNFEAIANEYISLYTPDTDGPGLTIDLTGSITGYPNSFLLNSGDQNNPLNATILGRIDPYGISALDVGASAGDGYAGFTLYATIDNGGADSFLQGGSPGSVQINSGTNIRIETGFVNDHETAPKLILDQTGSVFGIPDTYTLTVGDYDNSGNTARITGWLEGSDAQIRLEAINNGQTDYVQVDLGGDDGFHVKSTLGIGLELTLPLLINGDAGTATYVLTSNGPGLAPTWEPGGGGGGSPASPDRSIQINNSGSFGSDSVFIPSAGNITFGSVSLSGSRAMTVESSSTNAGLLLVGKGTGPGLTISLGNTEFSNFLNLGAPGDASTWRYLNAEGTGDAILVLQPISKSTNSTNILLTGQALGTGDISRNVHIGSLGGGFRLTNAFTEDYQEIFMGRTGVGEARIITRSGSASAEQGTNLRIQTGNGVVGDADGGDISIYSGRASGSGQAGSIRLASGENNFLYDAPELILDKDAKILSGYGFSLRTGDPFLGPSGYSEIYSINAAGEWYSSFASYADAGTYSASIGFNVNDSDAILVISSTRRIEMYLDHTLGENHFQLFTGQGVATFGTDVIMGAADVDWIIAGGDDNSVRPGSLTVRGGNSENLDGADLTLKSGEGLNFDGNITIDALRGYLILGNIPTSAVGLPTGAVWSNGGVLTLA